MGAQEALIGSQFGNGSGNILLDELDCDGNETSILQCKFDPWTINNCNYNEWVGVSCIVDMVTSDCDPSGVSCASWITKLY